jgi:8-oxo-dGTP pyrophosphatase MutT (NUDIX family)
MKSTLRQTLDPLATPLFRTWWRFNRGMTLGVRGLACDEAGRVLLIRHTYNKGWFLPGGGIERGETAPQALAREMAEEGGVQIEGEPVLVGFYSNHAVFRHDHVVLYRVSAWRPCPPLENGEIAERGFFARDVLPEGVSAGTRRRLAEVFDGAPIAAEW